MGNAKKASRRRLKNVILVRFFVSTGKYGKLGYFPNYKQIAEAKAKKVFIFIDKKTKLNKTVKTRKNSNIKEKQ